MNHVTWATPFSGMIKRLTFDIACKHTKFDDPSFSRSRDISGVCNSRRRRVALTTALRGQLIKLVICRLVLLVAKPCIKFEVCSFSRSKDISWGVKF